MGSSRRNGVSGCVPYTGRSIATRLRASGGPGVLEIAVVEPVCQTITIDKRDMHVRTCSHRVC
jgi:hypothetical protein